VGLVFDNCAVDGLDQRIADNTAYVRIPTRISDGETGAFSVDNPAGTGPFGRVEEKLCTSAAPFATIVAGSTRV